MKKKLLALLLATTLLALSLSGCGNDPAPTGGSPSAGDASPSVSSDSGVLTIGFSVASLDFPYYVTMLDAFKAACDAKGWEYIVADSGLDAEKALNDCADMILNKVDALIISSWYGDTLADVFDQCESVGIPVFLIDTGTAPREANFVTDIGTNSYDAGYYGGIWAAHYFRDEMNKTDINLINVINATAQSRDRADGFMQGMRDAGASVELLNEYIGDSREGYMASCEDALVAYNSIDLIYGANALGSLGAFDACEAANRQEIKIIGFDGEAEELEKIDAGTNYIASIMQQPALMAEQTVQNIDDYLHNGAQFEKTTPCDSSVYCSQGVLTIEDIKAAK